MHISRASGAFPVIAYGKLSRPGRLGLWVAGNAAVTIAYYLFGLAVGTYFSAYGLFPAPIWLPASVALVAAMIGRWRLFPGIFLGSLWINASHFEAPLLVAGLISLTNALGPVIGAQLIDRMRPGTSLFTRFSGVVIFVLCAVLLYPAITATGGTIALNLEKPFEVGVANKVWISWWLCDSGGTLCFAPTLLLWLGCEKMPRRSHRLGRRDVLVWLAVAATSIALFAYPPLPFSLYTLVPFLLVVPLSWIALQISLGAAYSLASLVAVIAMAGTAAGLGPFHAQTVINPLQLAGLLIVLLTMNVLTIVALFCERHAAEEASRSKTMLLATASHDLRTPLNAIIGFADMMRQGVWGPIENPRYRDYVDTIHASGSMLLGLIHDILDRSRIETGKRQIHPMLLEARPVVQSCLDLIAPLAAGKRIALRFDNAIAGPLYADELALKQILLNLLSNAVKFTPEAGAVTMRIATDAESGAGLLEISDTGPGMDAEGLRVALEPFGQIGGTARARQDNEPQGERGQPDSRRAEGVGLGLPNVARLAELHGTKLVIDSAPGRGTTMRINFPAAKFADRAA
ncbi:MAG TPA: ATP-binding protein [Dongiaceae bacterium]|nr:ATP-binding protein [Dongiaceae bacterium]